VLVLATSTEATTGCSALFADDLASGGTTSCGDGLVDVEQGETCEASVPIVRSCTELLGQPATGNVRCAACRLDLRSCLPLGTGGSAGSAGAGFAGATGIGGASGGAAPLGGSAGVGGATVAGSAGMSPAGNAGMSPAGSGGIAGAGGAAGTSAGAGGESGASGTSSGAGGTSSGAGGTSSGAGGTSSGAGGMGSGGSVPEVCSPTCAPFLTCVQGACVCAAGSVAVGAGCWPQKPTPAASRTVDEVCAARAMGRQELHADELTKTAGKCGPWLPSVARLGDIANRINYFRWLAGMAPVPPQLVGGLASRPHAECAAAAAYATNPTATSTCSTPEGFAASGRSFRFPQLPGADTIDTYIGATFANGTDDSYRLQLLRQHIKPFFWGEFAGGGLAGGGSCLEIPSDVSPTTLASAIWPPAGIVPVELASARWTIAPLIPGTPALVTVTDTVTSGSKAVQVHFIDEPDPNGPHAVIVRSNWAPLKDRTYEVRVEQGGDTVLAYAFTPTECP
jgi:hypothetical protein